VFHVVGHMLQIFHLDVSKVDLDVAHVSMAIHACFKCFICFQTYIANVLALFACLIICTFQLVFQSELCFSLTANQRTGLLPWLFSEANGLFI
jgi:hypothetical protein